MKKDKEQTGVKNDEKQTVSYIPRKCATNRLITSKDHASVQISVADVDENGKLTGTSKTYNFCGFVRALGEIDDSLNRLATEDGYLERYITLIFSRIFKTLAGSCE